METEKGQRLNWQQACLLLGCSKTHFYRIVNEGRLPAYRVGRRGLWVYEADCRALVLEYSQKREEGDV